MIPTATPYCMKAKPLQSWDSEQCRYRDFEFVLGYAVSRFFRYFWTTTHSFYTYLGKTTIYLLQTGHPTVGE